MTVNESRAAYRDELPDAPTPKIFFDQQQPPQTTPSQAPDSTLNPQTQAAQSPHDSANDEVPKRIFFFIPNFMTANDQPQNQGPLSTKEKFNIAWHQFFDVSAHIGNLIQASISQASNGIPHYGQGWGAFGERFAAQEGDQFTGSFLIYGILPSALHDDPRYFRKGRGKAVTRIVYAATRVLICRTDSGHSTFNAPQIFGQLGQASISMLYYPQQDRNVGGVFSGWAINQFYAMGYNQLKEFTPDLGAWLRRRHEKKREEQAAKAAAKSGAPADQN